jgi:type IV pilus assembly protein PilO
MTTERRSAFSERLRSPMTWHWAGVVVISILVAGLVFRLIYVWTFNDASATQTLEGKQAQLEALKQDTLPLRGLDTRVAATRDRIGTFYANRIPASYSLVATRIAELEQRSGAHLSRVSYSQGPPGSELTEISMDASISGEYPQMMRFVNGLERDQVFFIIKAMQLNGQQGGQANLRLRVSTWLRAADAAASGLRMMRHAGETSSPSSATPSATGREGN